jgi:hypothetical protein
VGFQHSGGTWGYPGVEDYNGDNWADIVIIRSSNGAWYIPGIGSFAYGQNGDITIAPQLEP